MHGLLKLVHECLGCLDCLHVAAPNEEVLSPGNPRRHHATGKVLRRCGVGEHRCTYISIYRCGDTGTPGLECVLDCMLQKHRAIGLQTDCMMVVPAPVVRLPDSHVYALWP